MLPECELEYRDEIGSMFHGNLDDVLPSLRAALDDDFVRANFKRVDEQTILDSLSTTSKLEVGELSVKGIRMATYDRIYKSPWGKGMGVMGLSKIVFSRNGEAALVYYEFYCGPKCASGEVLFLSKESDQWRVTKRERIWIS